MKTNIIFKTIQYATTAIIVYLVGQSVYELATISWKECLDSLYEIPQVVIQY
jgi:hypothetical protein